MPAAQTVTNHPLAKPLRTQLENTVKAARDVAEKAKLDVEFYQDARDALLKALAD